MLAFILCWRYLQIAVQIFTSHQPHAPHSWHISLQPIRTHKRAFLFSVQVRNEKATCNNGLIRLFVLPSPLHLQMSVEPHPEVFLHTCDQPPFPHLPFQHSSAVGIVTMGKNKRIQKTSKKNKVHKLTKPAGISKAQPKSPAQAQGKETAKKPHIQHSQSKPILPFSRHDKILLVGEGDLSFSRSLISSHKCENVTATVLEGSEKELIEKYPVASENIEAIREGGGIVKCAIDVGNMNRKKLGLNKGDAGWDRVFFNFPHVGGKSKDVNRQVRYNQGTFPPLL